MTQIKEAYVKEAYVSFETAKLLKEKGFDEYNPLWYNLNKPFEGPFYYKEIGWYGHNSYDYNGKNIISAPTQQMAMRWLRDVHSLHIEILATYHFRTFDGYSFEIYDISKGEFINYQSDKGLFKTAEDATENAIKYCLTNLI